MSRYNRLYRDRGAEALPLGVSRYNAATRPGLCCDTAGPMLGYGRAGERHGAARLRHRRPQAATRPVLGHDTTPLCSTIRRGARGMGAPCTQPGSVGCAPVHPTQFWTQCTVSESLFGTLFMSTVNKIFQKKKKKK